MFKDLEISIFLHFKEVDVNSNIPSNIAKNYDKQEHKLVDKRILIGTFNV